MTERMTLDEFAHHLHLPMDEVQNALAAQRRALPWYAEAVAALGGWLAALTLTGAFGSLLFGASGNEASLGILGLIGTVAGAIGHRRFTGAFGHQFALALMLAGQTLMVTAVGVSANSLPPAAAVAVVLAMVLVPLVPDRMHQFLTVAAAVILPITAMLIDKVPYAIQIAALVSVPSGVALLLYPTRPLDTRPAAFVLLLTAPFCDAFASFVSEFGIPLSTGWGGRLAYLIGLAWPFALLWPQAAKPGRILLLGAAAAAVTTILLLPAGLVAGLLFMVLAYTIGSRLLAGLGVVLEIFFMTHLYYDLRLNLMHKSLLLAAIGAVLLALWLAWRRLLTTEAQP